MKHLATIVSAAVGFFAALFLFAPLAASATPTSWDFAGGVLQPLQSAWGATVKATKFTATSTTAASVFPYASTTGESSSYSSSTKAFFGTLTVPSLGTAAGTFLAADANGKVIATTTPSSGGTGTVTNIATTYPILGGPITTTGTLSLAFGTTTLINAGTGISTSSAAGGAITVTNTSPLTGLTAAFPFSFDGAHTLTWSGLATTSPGITAGQPLYATGARTIASVASSTFLTSIGGQASGNYITALTGDVTASGPGSVAATLATVNSNVGTFTYPSVTVNGKGLITAISNGSAPTTYTASWPITLAGSAFGFNGLATTSSWTAGQLATVINGNTVAGVSTSTLTATSPLTGSFTQVGSGGSLGLGTVGVANGGTGSTTLSGILIGNGTSAVNTLTVGSGLTLTGTTLTASGGSSFSWPWTQVSAYGATNQSTTSPMQFQGAINASSTLRVKTNLLSTSNAGFFDIQRDAQVAGNGYTIARIKAPTGASEEATLSLVDDFDANNAGVNERFIDFYNEHYAGSSEQAGLREFATGNATLSNSFVFGWKTDAIGKDAGNVGAFYPWGGWLLGGPATSTAPVGTLLTVSSTSAATLLQVKAGTGSERFTVLGTGNVGVGTTSPYARLSVVGTVVGQNFVATSTTATSTFAGDLVIGANGSVLPNPYLFIGTSTAAVPLYGRVQGDLVDAEYDWNGQSSINVANANTGSCASATYFADGNNPTLGGYYGTFSFLNDGWTGSGCSIGAGTAQKPEAVVLANPTGEMDFVIASTTNTGSADFNWFSNTNTPLMKLTNGGNLGIGTTSPFTKLAVAGTITADSINATSTTATSLFSGTLSVLTHFITVISAAFTPATAGELGIDTTDNQLKYLSNSATRVLSPDMTAAFTYSTSTAWTGTTTVQLGPSFYAETWNKVICYTDTGTVNVQFVNAASNLNMFNASTTKGTVVLSTNNAFAAGASRSVQLGTPASSPTTLSCTVSKTRDAT